jgi:hypothetical protein
MSSGTRRASRKGSRGHISTGDIHFDDNDGSSETQTQTVGTLLAAIATCMTEALRILMFADKRQWGPDEFEQTRVLEEALDEAKKDFQEMAPLVHGQFYYENDRTRLYPPFNISLLPHHPFLPPLPSLPHPDTAHELIK